VKNVAAELGCGDVVVNDAIAKVSIVGLGMINTPGVAARMFAALAERQINIQMIATSEIKISCLVAEADGVKALKAVHQAFHLDGLEKVIVPA
ncbi:MAG: ACT domain-containing protein, partial [Cyanobacteria bacterium P01_D01_bin.71]